MDATSLEPYLKELGLKPPSVTELLSDEGLVRPWRVTAVDRGLVTLLGFDDAGAAAELRARSPEGSVTVGDWAVVDDEESSTPKVARTLERRSWLERGSTRDGRTQLIAANVDEVFVVAAFAVSDKLERRSIRARRLDRFIAAVRAGNAIPVVVVNKVDLSTLEPTALEAWRNEFSARLGGTEVVTISAKTRTGLETLVARLTAGETVAFVGPSGVGKSTIVNALVGDDVQATGAVRSKDSKGRHTTTRRELLRLPTGALLIDTPGIREFTITPEAQEAGFEDISDLADDCRFADCRHDTEPGCAVVAAVERGELPDDRVRSFRDLQRERLRLEAKYDPYARHVERAEQRRTGRIYREAMSAKRKHRGESDGD